MKRFILTIPLFLLTVFVCTTQTSFADPFLNLHKGFNSISPKLNIVCYSNSTPTSQNLSDVLPLGYGTGVATKVSLTLPTTIKVGTVNLTGVLYDSYNKPVGDAQIVFNGVLTGTITTDSSGVFTGTLTASKAQTAPLTATVNGKPITVNSSTGTSLSDVVVAPAQAANLVSGLAQSSLSSNMGWGLYYDYSTGVQMAAGSSSGSGQYIQVDLLKAYSISSITINGWNSSYGKSDLKNFRVDYLDPSTSTWKTAYTGTFPNVSSNVKYTFTTVQARYVKVYATSAGYWGNQVWLKYFVG
jgi:hypothetical protein